MPSEFAVICLCDGIDTNFVFLCVFSPLLICSTLRSSDFDKDTMVSLLLLLIISVELLPVDGDESDDTSGSCGFVPNSSIGLVVAFGCFLDCHSTLLCRASLVMLIPINSKHWS